MTSPAMDASTIQRRAADPGASVWVNASAGTGKTKVLTDRVLRLLLAGVRPERILCLTYTKAGAAEMAVRLQQGLGKWIVADDAKLDEHLEALMGPGHQPDAAERSRARHLFARVLEAPGGLQIQTIHSFCTALLRRFPVEAGVSPRFRLIEDAAARATEQQALNRVLGGGPLSTAVQTSLDFLTGQLNPDDFTKVIKALLAERGRLRRELERAGSKPERRGDELTELIAEAYEALDLQPGDAEADIRRAACVDPAMDEKGLRAALRLMLDQGTTKGSASTAASMEPFLAATPDQRPALLDSYLTAFFIGGGLGTIKAKLATNEVIAAKPALLAEAERLRVWRERWRGAKIAEASGHLLTVGKAIVDTYQAIKRRQGLLDFDDLILTSRALLAGPDMVDWVLFKLDGGIDHLLIDEAQDTNPEQWEIVQTIANEFFAGLGAAEDRDDPVTEIRLARSLFVVGDDKQSIFSFQRASPETFKSMRGHFDARVKASGHDWREIELSHSFRTSPPVLALVDAVFASQPARSGVARDIDHVIRHRSSRQGQAGRVELWPLEPRFAGDETPDKITEPIPWLLPPDQRSIARSAQSRLAERMAGQIADWIEHSARLEPYDRPVSAGDVLVLVQRRNGFIPALLRALQQRGVPVAGADRMVLTQQLAVRDLLALAEFLLLPEDDLVLAAVLKSPLIGLDENRLMRLAIARRTSLWAALSQQAGQDPLLQSIREYLAGLLGRVDLATPYQLFADLLHLPCPATGDSGQPVSGRQAMLARLGRDTADPLDEFLERCLGFQRDQPGSLQQFLDWLATGAPEIKRDQDGAADTLRIMTVHGSKGLQAPIVFMPDTVRMPDHRDNPPLWPVELRDPGPPLWTPAAGDLVGAALERREQGKRRRAEEYHRLLYVAMTRAADWLIVCGWETGTKTSDDCWYALTGKGVAQLAEQGETVIEQPLAGEPADSPRQKQVYFSTQSAAPKIPTDTASLPAAEPLPDWVRRPAPKPAETALNLTPSSTDSARPAASPVRGERGGGGSGEASGIALRRGQLAHRLLQWLPATPTDVREQRLRDYLARPVHGLAQAELDQLADEVLAILDHPDFAPLFGPDSLAEVAVSGRLPLLDGGSARINGQIDRLVDLPDRVLIVDYKTNRPPPTRLEDVPDAYRRQLACYAALVGRLYPDKPVETALLWTVETRLMPIPASARAGFLAPA